MTRDGQLQLIIIREMFLSTVFAIHGELYAVKMLIAFIHAVTKDWKTCLKGQLTVELMIGKAGI